QINGRIYELETENKNVQVLNDEVARLTMELNQQSGNRVGLETELTAERERTAQLSSRMRELEIENEQVKVLAEEEARVTVELAEIKRSNEVENGYRANLESELQAERAKVNELTTRLEHAEVEFTQYRTRMQEEQEAARKGIDLLMR